MTKFDFAICPRFRLIDSAYRNDCSCVLLCRGVGWTVPWTLSLTQLLLEKPERLDIADTNRTLRVGELTLDRGPQILRHISQATAYFLQRKRILQNVPALDQRLAGND